MLEVPDLGCLPQRAADRVWSQPKKEKSVLHSTKPLIPVEAKGSLVFEDSLVYIASSRTAKTTQ